MEVLYQRRHLQVVNHQYPSQPLAELTLFERVFRLSPALSVRAELHLTDVVCHIDLPVLAD